MMIEVSRMKHDWEYQNYRVNGETVRASLEFSPQRRPLGKAQTSIKRQREHQETKVSEAEDKRDIS